MVVVFLLNIFFVIELYRLDCPFKDSNLILARKFFNSKFILSPEFYRHLSILSPRVHFILL